MLRFNGLVHFIHFFNRLVKLFFQVMRTLHRPFEVALSSRLRYLSAQYRVHDAQLICNIFDGSGCLYVFLQRLSDCLHVRAGVSARDILQSYAPSCCWIALREPQHGQGADARSYGRLLLRGVEPARNSYFESALL